MVSHCAGLKTITECIESFDIGARADRKIDIDTVPGSVVPFVTANEELIKILRRRESPPLGPCTPPHQTTVPADPKYSGDSVESASSWSSSDSREEHFTHQFAYQFVNASRRAVERQLQEIPWLLESCNELISRFWHCSPGTNL